MGGAVSKSMDFCCSGRQKEEEGTPQDVQLFITLGGEVMDMQSLRERFEQGHGEPIQVHGPTGVPFYLPENRTGSDASSRTSSWSPPCHPSDTAAGFPAQHERSRSRSHFKPYPARSGASESMPPWEVSGPPSSPRMSSAVSSPTSDEWPSSRFIDDCSKLPKQISATSEGSTVSLSTNHSYTFTSDEFEDEETPRLERHCAGTSLAEVEAPERGVDGSPASERPRKPDSDEDGAEEEFIYEQREVQTRICRGLRLLEDTSSRWYWEVEQARANLRNPLMRPRSHSGIVTGKVGVGKSWAEVSQVRAMLRPSPGPRKSAAVVVDEGMETAGFERLQGKLVTRRSTIASFMNARMSTSSSVIS
uniref:Uncharacterized protein n=1 Tax=Alexandrium monilatum TaxID=311494 RepID=A0A7S4ST90_9DINO|mmetsp:Transcript_109888/g.328580  ORF Transcript_109888/g.328580 Transcript_109888/m.328580 type:complete len:362 (-) Transcript_109888:239-1324(-)